MMKCFVTIVFTLSFALASYAQTVEADINSTHVELNPLFRSAFKNPVKANPLLAECIKPSKYELMCWPNYPLTAAQIAERQRKNNEPFGKQIADDIISTVVSNIIYGKKTAPAKIPKF